MTFRKILTILWNFEILTFNLFAKNQHKYTMVKPEAAYHLYQITMLSNDSVYAQIGTVDSGENRIGKSFKMAALYQKRVDTFPKLG